MQKKVAVMNIWVFFSFKRKKVRIEPEDISSYCSNVLDLKGTYFKVPSKKL